MFFILRTMTSVFGGGGYVCLNLELKAHAGTPIPVVVDTQTNESYNIRPLPLLGPFVFCFFFFLGVRFGLMTLESGKHGLSVPGLPGTLQISLIYKVQHGLGKMRPRFFSFFFPPQFCQVGELRTTH